MTALYIAGYALGAVLTWVLCVRAIARAYPGLGWGGSDLCFSVFMALLWLPWGFFVALIMNVVAADWPSIKGRAPGTRLFNYFKRRG